METAGPDEAGLDVDEADVDEDTEAGPDVSVAAAEPDGDDADPAGGDVWSWC